MAKYSHLMLLLFSSHFSFLLPFIFFPHELPLHFLSPFPFLLLTNPFPLSSLLYSFSPPSRLCFTQTQNLIFIDLPVSCLSSLSFICLFFSLPFLACLLSLQHHLIFYYCKCAIIIKLQRHHSISLNPLFYKRKNIYVQISICQYPYSTCIPIHHFSSQRWNCIFLRFLKLIEFLCVSSISFLLCLSHPYTHINQLDLHSSRIDTSLQLHYSIWRWQNERYFSWDQE